MVEALRRQSPNFAEEEAAFIMRAPTGEFDVIDHHEVQSATFEQRGDCGRGAEHIHDHEAVRGHHQGFRRRKRDVDEVGHAQSIGPATTEGTLLGRLTEMDARPVGIFDSGVGGLGVLRYLREMAPSEDFLYFADTAYFPYGPRPAAEVRKRAFAVANRLLAADAKMIVVACNTASAAAIEDLRASFPVPFVGMVPGVKPAASTSRSGRVAILATAGTLDGDLMARVVEEFGRGTKIASVSGAGLAELVEQGRAQSPAARAAVRRALESEVQAGADTVVLGCTHYHFLADAIRAEFPDIQIVDTSEAVARRAVQVLAENDLAAPEGRAGEVRLIVSGDRERFHASMSSLGFSRASAGVGS